MEEKEDGGGGGRGSGDAGASGVGARGDLRKSDKNGGGRYN